MGGGFNFLIFLSRFGGVEGGDLTEGFRFGISLGCRMRLCRGIFNRLAGDYRQFSVTGSMYSSYGSRGWTWGALVEGRSLSRRGIDVGLTTNRFFMN